MPWSQFNAKDEMMYKQAVHHATARYFLLYLQDKEKLDDVFTAFQRLDIAAAEGTLAQQAVRLVENIFARSIDQVENDFTSWLEGLGHTPSADDIRRIQHCLNAMGYAAGAADGLVGPQTRTALKAFQMDHDLAPTGRIDTTTWDMFQAPATSP